MQKSRIIKPLKISYAWIVVWVTFLVAIAGSVVSNKVSPITPALMQNFGIDISQAGLLTFAVSVVSLLVAFPAGMLVNKLGVRVTGLLGLSALIAGSLLGASTRSFWVLVSSRALEGFGIVVLTVVPITAIAQWIPAEKRGLPMGIWSTATPIGAYIAMVIAPVLELNFGWISVWLASSGFSILILLIYAVSISDSEERKPGSVDQPSPGIQAIFREKSIWLLGLAMAMYSFSYMPVIIFYPTYLNEVFDMPLTEAGFLVGVISLVAIPGSPLLGWLSDNLKTRKWIITAGYIILIPITGLVFWIPESLISVAMILIGLTVCAVPTLIFASAPEIISDQGLTGTALGVITALMYLGTMLTIPIFGEMVEIFGWQIAGISNLIPAFFGLVLILFNRKLR